MPDTLLIIEHRRSIPDIADSVLDEARRASRSVVPREQQQIACAAHTDAIGQDATNTHDKTPAP